MKDCTTELRDDALISNLYHSIAQPLTALRGTLDLALRKPLDAIGYRQAIEEAIEQHERLVRTIKEVRQIADAFAPRDELPCDVTTLVCEILDDFEPVAQQDEVVFVRRIEPEIRISCDESKLRQLVFLLVDHVLHACGPGELVIEASLIEETTVRIVCSTAHAVEAASSSDPTRMLRLVLLKSLKADFTHDAIDGRSDWILSIPACSAKSGPNFSLLRDF